MSHEINKQNIFNFLKAESIIIEINVTTEIEILESKNIETDKLQVVKLTTLNSTSKYWKLDPETTTFLQSKNKKVESIILEHTNDGTLNIILLEMKSKKLKETDVEEKFKNSLSWVYILLNLLDGKENQKIKVYGILVAQKNMNWNKNDTLNILSSTSIRYKKKSFYTPDTSIDIPINDLLI